MKIYVACHSQAIAQAVAGTLTRAGHRVVSTWLDRPFGPTENFTEGERTGFADENHADVYRADALVLIAGPCKVSGGKFVEAGFALALDKIVIVLGRRENTQLWDSRVRQVETEPQLIGILAMLDPETGGILVTPPKP